MSRILDTGLRLAATLCLVGCSQSAQAAGPRRVGCSPEVLGPDSTLVMTLPLRHGAGLQIEAPEPESILYTVIMHLNPRFPGYRPMIAGQRFQNMASLALKVKDIKGDDEDPQVVKKSRRQPQTVFTIGGNYSVYYESYDGPWYVLCKLHYVDKTFKGSGPKRRYTPGFYD